MRLRRCDMFLMCRSKRCRRRRLLSTGKRAPGFEVAFFHRVDQDYHVVGSTAAAEAGVTWIVG